MALPRGAMAWSGVCDCGISGLYSLFQESTMIMRRHIINNKRQPGLLNHSLSDAMTWPPTSSLLISGQHKALKNVKYLFVHGVSGISPKEKTNRNGRIRQSLAKNSVMW